MASRNNDLLTMTEIRQSLTRSLRDLKSGKLPVQQANAESNVIGKYMYSIKLEMEYHKLTGDTPHIELFNGAKKQLR